MRRPLPKYLFALAALLVCVWLVRPAHFTSPSGAGPRALTDLLGLPFTPPPPGLIGAGASLGLLLLGGWFAGRIAAALGIAKVTGYLLLGLLVGPHALGLVALDQIGYLTLINDLAVALIALTAGAEIRAEFLRESWRQVLLIALGVVSIVALAFFLLMLFALPAMGVTPAPLFPPGLLALALAAVLATIATSNSPAIVIALIAELRARGPMTRLALSVTVCKDMLLVVLFSIVLALAAAAIDRDSSTRQISTPAVAGAISAPSPANPPPAAHTTPESAQGIALPLLARLLGSILIGAVIGMLMASYMHWVGAHLPIFLILACFGIALLSEALHLEALLVAVTAGMLMANAFEETSEALFESVEDLSLPVYCVFFAVAGLRVDLAALGSMWHWALLAVAVRMAGIWAGVRAACALSGALPPQPRRWLWTAFVPQAGVSLALATIVRDTFADQTFGPPLFNFILATIALHELIGPILMKLGLTRAGETNRK